MKRRGIPWGPKNPLWRWRKKHGLLGKWSKPRSRSRRVTSNPKRRRRFSLPRRRRRRRSSGMTIPIAPIAGLAGGMADPIVLMMRGDFDTALYQITARYTGYDTRSHSFNVAHLSLGLLPLVTGLLVHKFVGGPPLNLNRVLARAKVPFIRI